MQVLRGTQSASPPAGSGASRPAQSPIERGSAGLAALFEGLPANRSHAILDLGAAEGQSLAVYGRYARWVRFADVLTAAASPTGSAEAGAGISPNPARQYDLIVGWDIVERIPPGACPALLARLAEVAAPAARLLVVVESPDENSYELGRYTVLAADRMRIQRSGELRPPYPAIAPAEVKGLLAPFRLRHAFTTSVGLREYVAILRG